MFINTVYLDKLKLRLYNERCDLKVVFELSNLITTTTVNRLELTSVHLQTSPAPPQFLATSFQYPIPTSSETFDFMIEVAANRGFLVEMEARHVRTQVHELCCTAVEVYRNAVL